MHWTPEQNNINNQHVIGIARHREAQPCGKRQ